LKKCMHKARLVTQTETFFWRTISRT
jgi:hypothetical protein